MFNLSPKNDKFFDMFISFTKVISASAEALNEFVKNPSNTEEKFKKLREMEHEGDVTLHNILEELNNSFITPLDREDIYLLGKSLDDVVDYIEETAGSYMMYDVKESRDKALLLSANIVKAAKELEQLMVELKNMKGSSLLKQKIVEINRIENDCDVIYREAIRELFSTVMDAKELIIWKEIYGSLEMAIDSCEKLANVVEGVVTKHV